MKISDLELYLVEAPRSGANAPVVSLLVRVATESGGEGWGEAYVPWRPQELEARRELLLAALVGRHVGNLAELAEHGSLTQPALRCAVEMACCDALARLLRQPLCNLWGGVYRAWSPVAMRLPAGPVQHMVQAARELADLGFRCLIVASSGQTADDLQTIVQLRDALEDRAELRLDGARRLLLDEARVLAEGLPRGSVQYWLDPAADRGLEGLTALARSASVPLAVSAPLRSPADMFAAARTGAAGFAVLNLETLGGLTAARQCAAVAAAAGMTPSLAARPSLGIGTAAALQLVAATPALATANESAYSQLLDDVLVEPLRFNDGMLETPQGPGLGVEVDRAKVERYLLQ